MNNSNRQLMRRFVNALASIGAVVVSVIVFCFAKNAVQAVQLLIIFWALVPPLWFMLEYHVLYKEESDVSFDHFRHGQQLAGAVWLGVVAILLAYATTLG